MSMMDPRQGFIPAVIRALNERENLELLLPSLWAVTERLGLVAEIIVVDGGSADGSRLAAEKPGARVITQEERGYGGPPPPRFWVARAPVGGRRAAELCAPPSSLGELL